MLSVPTRHSTCEATRCLRVAFVECTKLLLILSLQESYINSFTECSKASQFAPLSLSSKLINLTLDPTMVNAKGMLSLLFAFISI